MSDVPPRAPRRGFRRVLIGVSLLLLALLVVVLSAPWWFDARRVSSLALDRASAATGLAWRIDGEPELRWRPSPWLALPGLRVTDAGGREVLGAARVELALPWSTLRGEAFRIEALRLEAPVIDIEAGLDWWQAQPADVESPLPALDRVEVSAGRLHWAGGEADAIHMRLADLAPGRPATLQASARVRWIGDGATAPLTGAVTLHASPRLAPFRLEDLHVALSGEGVLPTTAFDGRLQVSPWQLHAAGRLADWPAAWPALPAPMASSRAPIDYVITQDGASARDAEATLALHRDEASVEVRGVPSRLLDWQAANGGDAPRLPPLSAEATLPAVELDGFRLDGVRLRIREDDSAPSQSP